MSSEGDSMMSVVETRLQYIHDVVRLPSPLSDFEKRSALAPCLLQSTDVESYADLVLQEIDSVEEAPGKIWIILRSAHETNATLVPEILRTIQHKDSTALSVVESLLDESSRSRPRCLRLVEKIEHESQRPLSQLLPPEHVPTSWTKHLLQNIWNLFREGCETASAVDLLVKHITIRSNGEKPGIRKHSNLMANDAREALRDYSKLGRSCERIR